MKVLFAVNNESISETIIKKYQKIYDELLEYKNVYYYNAIVKEIQNENNYDVIVISEDLETISSNDKNKVDTFVLDKLEKITDVFKVEGIESIPILFISNEKRTIKDVIIPAIFNLGIYNGLVEKDRTITKICELIKNPRTEAEARLYYNLKGIDKLSVEQEIVNPKEINNILRHYKKILTMPDRYSSSFDRIASQYDDLQLKYIIDKLPEDIKLVLEKENTKYKEVLELKVKTIQVPTEETKSISTSKSTMSDVIIPTEISKKNIKSQIQGVSSDSTKLKTEKMSKPVIKKDKILEIKAQKEVKEIKETKSIEIEEEQPLIKDLDEDIKDVDKEKEKIGASINEIVIEGNDDDLDLFLDIEEEIDDEDDFIPIFGVGEIEEKIETEIDIKTDENSEIETEIDKSEKIEENIGLEISEIDGDDIDIFVDEILTDDDVEFSPVFDNIVEETPVIEQSKVEVPTKKVEKNTKDLLSQESKEFIVPDLSAVLSKDKKVVVFVGTSKNGTSFLVNSLGMMFASIGINTAILDMTQNRNSYYLSTKNDERLRQIAVESTAKLREGIAMGVDVVRGLSVFTALPGDKDNYSDVEKILSTLVKSYSLVLIDADFNTDFGYFSAAQEIYLVQSLDVLTIQPLTAFLKELLDARILTTEKVKVVLNKEVAVRGLTRKLLVGGISTYNDPAMSIMTNLFDRNQVQVVSIPFDQNVYSKYLENIVECKYDISGYPKKFVEALKILANMVYPLVSRQRDISLDGNISISDANQTKTEPFTNDISSTLDQMRRKI